MEEEKTISEDLVVTKYKMAGEIANRVLKKIIEKCVVGAKVLDICDFGDEQILAETSVCFKKEKELKKGIAFPTCVSVNNCICHYSPLRSDPDVLLKENDLVKIDLGAHIDGFIAVVAHTVIVGGEKPVKGRLADVYLAAYNAAEIALRLIKPGNGNYAVTDAIQKTAESFNCKPISGMLSHQLKQFRIDGEKSIIQNPSDAQRKEHEKCQFNLHEVYAIDVLVSTGEGKGKEVDAKTTVYKKTDDNYQLKLKFSRAFYADAEKKFGVMPFTLRAFEDEKKAKLGILECVKHHLMDPFNVLYEKDNELVAQFKFTILLLPSGTKKITGLPINNDDFKSEFSIQDEELKKILATSLDHKKKKSKSKTSGDSKNSEEGEQKA